MRYKIWKKQILQENVLRKIYLLIGLFGLLTTGLAVGLFFCCPGTVADFAGGLCCLTTGATVAVALGFAGGFLLAAGFTLLGDSSDSDEYTTDLFFGGTLSLFLFSARGAATVSLLVFPCLLAGNAVFFFVLSASDAF